MPNHESHGHHGPDMGHAGHGPGLGHPGHTGHGSGHHGPGHHAHRPGMMGGPNPVKFFFVNAIITQMFARFWMVVSAIALMKIAHSLALGARVKTLKELREDLTEEQRAELVEDIWRRARRKRMANCPVMPMNCCSPKKPVAE